MVSSPPLLQDIPALLEQSVPRGGAHRLWYAAGVFLLVVMIATYLVGQSPAMEALVGSISFLLMLLLLIVMPLIMMVAVRRQRREQQAIESVHELVQLRRWHEAAEILQGLLSRPLRQMQHRMQALMYLMAVLARYERFSDAIAVQEHLLGSEMLDENARHAVRLARAMALLRDDRLYDADAAIGELRRSLAAGESAGMALVELYRDIKTGHPEEAVEIFQRKLPLMEQQLGMRVADAHVLMAAAFDRLGEAEQAGRHYRNATLLGAAVELHRRYPETAALATRYEAASPPEGP
jgi:tetratricopeptide (TPR) repeat protein